MIIDVGEKVHLIHRALFPGDVRRHFVGTVERSEDGLIRVRGYLFAMDAKKNQFVKRVEPRVRVVSLGTDAVIANILPAQVDIERISYEYRMGGDVLVTDGSEWHLDITHL
jgi:hypothetical protein